MSFHDVADLVATLSFPIVTEVGPADAPADAAALRDRVADWMAADGRGGSAPDSRQVDGVGFGLELLTTLHVPDIVIGVLLKESLQRGLTSLAEALRHRRGRHAIEAKELSTLLGQQAALRDAFTHRLVDLGLDDQQASELAGSVVSAMTKRADGQRPP